MGIRRYKTKGGVKYRAEIMYRGHRASKVFDSQLDAAVWYDKTERMLKQGIVPENEVAPGDMLFLEAADRFIVEARAAVSRGQIKNYQFATRQLLASFGQRVKMSQITPQDVAAHMIKRMNGDGVGPSIIRLEMSFIRLVYTRAINWGINLPSPELTIKRPRNKRKSREDGLDLLISAEELAAILAEAKNRQTTLYPYLLFLLYTGMRPTEAASLYWEKLPVKDEREAIKKGLPAGFIDLARGGFSKVGTKTESRFVPAHPVALAVVAQLPRPEGKKLVFLDDKYVGRDRAYLHYKRALQTTLAKARRPDGQPLRGGINFYSFRHTARSAMPRCGIPTEVSETIIGHQDKSFKFTYIHLTDADLVREIAKLSYPGIESYGLSL